MGTTMGTPSAKITIPAALKAIRQLPPRERLKILVEEIAEAEKELPGETAEPVVSLWGLLEKYGPAPSAEDIDEMRREVWANFPRNDF